MKPIDIVRAKLEGISGGGPEYKARCPAHDDDKPSLSIREDRIGNVLLKCHAECHTEKVVQAMGLEMRDLFAQPRQEGQGKHIAVIYNYSDEDGNLLFQTVRYEPKDFRQRRPNGQGGWIWSLNGIRRVLYRLPEVLQAVKAGRIVFIVEGEKDADALAALEFVATCSPMGTGKWRDEYAETFRDAHVVILPDNDEPGRRHANQIARSILPVAKEVRLIELPNLSVKGDVSDWLGAGGNAKTLQRLVNQTPPLQSAELNDEAEPVDEGKGERGRPSALDILLELAEPCFFFEGRDGTAYVRFPRGSGTITAAVTSKSFEHWLRREFYRWAESQPKRRGSKAPPGDTMQTAINTLVAKALYDPDVPGKQTVYLRSGGVYGDDGALKAIYIDLADEQGRVVEILPGTWRVIDRAPEGVFFLRTLDQLPLPEPDPDGELADALPLLRTESLEETVFILAWIVFCFHPRGPYPVLFVYGPAGSGKTTMCAFLRSVTDPVEMALRRPPKSVEEYFIFARNNRVLALENISKLSGAASDTLCSLSTGASIGGRTLYTNADETSFRACRPILLNGIDEVVTRGDLLSRALKVTVPPIYRRDRDTKANLDRRMADIRPRFFGGICTALAEALARPHHDAGDLPRMADFANFIDAAQDAFPPQLPRLIEAMAILHDRLAHDRAASSGVASALLKAVEVNCGRLEGDMKTWLKSLAEHRAEGTDWPENERALASDIQRVTPVLLHLGLEVRRDGQHPKTRRTRYVAEKVKGNPSNPSNPSQGVENSAIVVSNGDSFAEDVRRITEGSNHAMNDPLTDASGKKGLDTPVEMDFEGSKGPKDREEGFSFFDRNGCTTPPRTVGGHCRC